MTEGNEYLFQTLQEKGIVEEGTEDGRNNYVYISEFERLQPVHFLVVLTNKCNMNCKYCYAEANKQSKEKDISGHEWVKFFDEMHLGGQRVAQNISFTGGEPTLHPDLPNILRLLSRKYKFEISSNGLMISDELVDALKSLETLNYFNISMDSLKLSEDEVMRGKDTYDTRLRNITKLTAEGIPVCVAMTVSSMNLKSLTDTTKYFLDNFPISIKYIPLTRTGRALKMDDSFFIRSEEAQQYLKKVCIMRNKYEGRVLTDPSDEETELGDFHWSGRCSHMKIETRKMNGKLQNNIIASERCNAGYGVVSLTPSGSLRPCLKPNSFFDDVDPQFRKNVILSIRGKSRKEIESLGFWDIVTKESGGFDSENTCALKNLLRHEA
jgi:MoaA/NifB/PqqE/SkfB family radical SAM enzyme